MQAVHGSATASGAPVVERGPVSFQQEAMLQNLPRIGAAIPNVLTRIVRFSERPDAAALDRAIVDLTARHPMLRCRLEGPPGSPEAATQHVDAQWLSDVHWISAGDGAAETIEPVRFDPFREHMLAVRVIDSEHVDLVLDVHHLISDDWSFNVMLRDLAYAYGTRSEGATPAWSPPSMTYVDYARDQRAALESGALDSDFAYWRDLMRGAASVPWGDEPAATGADPFEAERSILEFTIEDAQRLRLLGARFRATPFLVLLALSKIAVYRATGADDIVSGSATANREDPASAEVVGFFANGRLTRTHIADGASVADVIAQVRDQWLEGLEHSSLHLEQLSQWLNADPDWVNLKISLHEQAPQTIRFGQSDARAVGFSRPARRRRDLTIDWVQQDERLLAIVERRRAAIGDTTYEAVTSALQTLVATLR